MEILDYLGQGMAFQGDLVIVPVQPESFRRSKEIRPTGNRLTLLEGEATGHHHVIDLSPEVVAIEKTYKSKQKPKAQLFEDREAALKIVADPNLCIGFLEIIGSPFLLIHEKSGTPTNEHDAIRLRAGTYYLGRQRQFDAGEVVTVED